MESQSYFARFPAFQIAATTPAIAEFNRLANQMNWREGSKRYKRERSKFFESEFGIQFGTDASNLANWQALCLELEIKSPIQSISQCRKLNIFKALAKVHVNLVDIVDSRRTGKKVKFFASPKALRKYTIETEKIFPKSAAKKDGFLKSLLRGIF
ncbi:hypothetical protein N7492_001823 [Penicillium capsulatum]|uniref:Uncharacterized protein n=1 Tax=Penicillium capsulatum TaxID=69766 RepID=A0A9W9M1K3_9EURO|nr:hypothetical protein N7492_001823 [Penicillium capsulatum]KAJ6129128.1 hypothetical protein N7512_001908 [Penicillium capsulatum]